MTRVPNTILHSTFIISVLAFSGVEAAGMNCWDKTISWKKECGYRGAIFVGALLGLIACTSTLCVHPFSPYSSVVPVGFLGWCAFVTLKSRYRNRQRVSVVEESGELLNTGTVADPDPGRGKTEGNVNVGSSKVCPSGVIDSRKARLTIHRVGPAVIAHQPDCSLDLHTARTSPSLSGRDVISSSLQRGITRT